jgi:hypothetical protein
MATWIPLLGTTESEPETEKIWSFFYSPPKSTCRGDYERWSQFPNRDSALAEAVDRVLPLTICRSRERRGCSASAPRRFRRQRPPSGLEGERSFSDCCGSHLLILVGHRRAARLLCAVGRRRPRVVKGNLWPGLGVGGGGTEIEKANLWRECSLLLINYLLIFFSDTDLLCYY